MASIFSKATRRLHALLTSKGGARPPKSIRSVANRGLVAPKGGPASPSGGVWARLTSGASALPSMRPLLKSPTVAERMAVSTHLLALRSKPIAHGLTRVRGGGMKPRPRPSAQAQPSRPAPPPAAPPLVQAQPDQFNMPEVDVTPTEQPRYDGFHGHTPSFGGPQEDSFGDLEADLGLD